MRLVRASAETAASRGHRVQRRFLPLLLGLAIAGWTTYAHASASVAPAADAAAAAPAGDSVDANFDRSMLSGAGQNTTDLSRFERGDFIPAGNYSVDIYLNERPIGRSDVRFSAPSPDASASPCFTRSLLDQLGLHPVDPSKATAATLADGRSCLDIADAIPGASATFDMADLRLDISVPQAFMGQAARGYVDPKFWDSGVTAGLLNYNFNSYRTSSRGISQTSSFLSLDAGLNIGRWHFRHDSSLTWQSAVGPTRSTQHWQNIASYAQRDLPTLRAQLTIGDSWTSGELFDSIGIRGIQLATDDRMLPQSLRGYAPAVRGVADSNAKVTVRQNGMTIYQTTVSPGPFVIKDLYATGYGGDLQVTVAEANGRVHSFSVPYASVPQLLRPSLTRFSVAAGQVRDRSIHDHPGLLQATVQHGFSNLLTTYTGITASTDYASALLGAAFNTRFGALAVDVTTARTRIPGMDTMSGQSLRLSYSKIMALTGTSLTVAAYRYSTSGYLSLGDAVRARDYARRGLPVFATQQSAYPLTINGVPVSGLLTPAQQAALSGIDPVAQSGVDRQRNSLSLTLSQPLGKRGGSLYVNGSVRDYWNRPGTDTQYQIGYNNSWGRVTYNLSAGRERDLFGHVDNRYMASLTIPLGNSKHSPLLTSSLAHDSANGLQEQASLNGTAGVDDRISYGATVTHDSVTGAGTTGSINGGYRGAHVLVNASVGAGSGYSQASLGIAGGVVAHPGGVTFGQSLGDTVALVEAPGAAGARITNAVGARVGKDGYALIPYLTPYALDTVSIDPTGLTLDVQLDNTSAQVAPRAGAVVLVRFGSQSGRFILIQPHLAGGAALPFGAEVQDEQGQVIGVVGQAGRIMVRVQHPRGHVDVRWQNDQGGEQTCRLPYRLPARNGEHGGRGLIVQIDASCSPVNDNAPLARTGS